MTIETWYENALAEPWPEESQGNFICVELRRRRASRLEAYKRAGLTLNRDRYAAIYVGTDRSEVARPYASAYSTSQERDAAVSRFNEIAEKRGEIYEVSVVTIPPAWPTDCRFTLPEQARRFGGQFSF